MAFGLGLTGGATPVSAFGGAYNINPSPQAGAGAYGAVPGPIGIPPSIYQQVSGVYPGLGAETGKAFDFANTELSGELSPETINTIKDQAAAWGVQSGMPGTTPGTLSGNLGLRNLGLNVEATQRQGATDFASILSSIGATQTDPNLAAGIASNNALMASAPNPSQAAAALEAQFLENLKAQYALGTASPAGGTGKYGYAGVSQPPNLRGGSPLTTSYSPLTAGGTTTSTPGGMYYGGVWYPAGTHPTNSTQPGYQLNPMYANGPSAQDDLAYWLDPFAYSPAGGGGGMDSFDSGSADYYGDY